MKNIEMLERKRDLVKVVTAGSVDDGKSTLLGRLLYDTQNVHQDIIDTISEQDSKIDFALLTDGLKAERDQGITIDVAHRYFSIDNKSYILYDSPGHKQYTRNMVTACSNADVALIILDITKGIRSQTLRHSFIVNMMKVNHVVVAINKMDLVDYDQSKFNEVVQKFRDQTEKLNFYDLTFIPVSAREGDNIVNKSETMTWYDGCTVMSYLENHHFGSSYNKIDFRFPVQAVFMNNGRRLLAGSIKSGSISVGEEILCGNRNLLAKVKSISTDQGKYESVSVPRAITLELDQEVDVGRGAVLTRVNNPLNHLRSVDAYVTWFSDRPLSSFSKILIQANHNRSTCAVEKVLYEIDVSTFSRVDTSDLMLNSIARVQLKLSQPLPIDEYDRNRWTGNFILICGITHETIAAGVNLNKVHDNSPAQVGVGNNLSDKGTTIWLTGLSGSGKTTIAKLIQSTLRDQNKQSLLVDGDILRDGICTDLSFDQESRRENVRRAAEICKMLNRQGYNAICSLISPLQEQRSEARRIIGENYFEVFVNTPIEECISRDPKGLYQKAIRNRLENFTGISSDYEAPDFPDLVVETLKSSAEEIAQDIIEKSGV